jgi:hypothetical protein
MNVVGSWLFAGFAYPRYPHYDDPGYDQIRRTEHIYADLFGDREFWVYHHSPGWDGHGHDTFIASARYMVSRGTWQIKELPPGYHFPATVGGEEPTSAPLAMQAILELARRSNARAADLPVYLSNRWPAPAPAAVDTEGVPAT